MQPPCIGHMLYVGWMGTVAKPSIAIGVFLKHRPGGSSSTAQHSTAEPTGLQSRDAANCCLHITQPCCLHPHSHLLTLPGVTTCTNKRRRRRERGWGNTCVLKRKSLISDCCKEWWQRSEGRKCRSYFPQACSTAGKQCRVPSKTPKSKLNFQSKLFFLCLILSTEQQNLLLSWLDSYFKEVSCLRSLRTQQGRHAY